MQAHLRAKAFNFTDIDKIYTDILKSAFQGLVRPLRIAPGKCPFSELLNDRPFRFLFHYFVHLSPRKILLRAKIQQIDKLFFNFDI